MVVILSVDVGTRNLAFALLEWNSDDDDENDRNDWKSVRLLHWEKVDVLRENGCKARNSRAVPPLKISQFVTSCLLARADPFYRSQVVLVESQPKSSRMKCIAVQICEHFRLEAHMAGYPDIELALKSGKNKLSMDLDTTQIASDTSTWQPMEYHDRKKESIRRASVMLERIQCDESCRKAWANADKHDDMADAIMQGLAYIQAKQTQTQKMRKKPKKQK